MLKQFFLREPRHLEALLAFLDQNWKAMADQGTPMAVTLTDAKAKRSTQANRYYWALLNQIAEDAWIEGRQYSAEVWHDYMKRRFIGSIDLPGGQTMAESSASLNTAEFAKYTEQVEVCAAQELGVTLLENLEPIGRVS